MLIDGIELKELAKKTKKEYKEKMNNYNNNIKRMGKRAQELRAEYDIPYTEISMLSGASSDAVSDYLRGKSTPHLLTATLICKAVNVLFKCYQQEKDDAEMKKMEAEMKKTNAT